MPRRRYGSEVYYNCPHCEVQLNMVPEDSNVPSDICENAVGGETSCQFEACVQVRRITSRIAALEMELRQLRRELPPLKTRQNALHSPFLRLPFPEVISEIFMFSAADDTSAWSLDEHKPNEQSYAESYRKQTPRSICPLVLGAVCRRWRDVAWSTPQLWSSIRINLYGAHIECHKVEIVDDWLQRSGQLPLSIYINGGELNDTSFRRPPFGAHDREGAFPALVELVNSYSNRWETLFLKLPSSWFSKFHGNHEPRSMLRTLGLGDPSRRGTTPFKISNAMAMPENVILRYVPFDLVDIDWSHLKLMDVAGFNVAEWLRILAKAPELRICKLTESLPAYRNQPASLWPAEVVTHHRLEELHVSCSAFVNRLLEAIRLPSLRYLSWDGYKVMPVDSLSSMIKRSSPPLTELVLSGLKASGILFQFLENIPTLQRLSVYSHKSHGTDKGDNTLKNDPFFELLVKTSIEDESSFLPNLRSLTLSMPQDTNWWTYVPAVFGPIHDIGKPRRRPLKHLHIRGLIRDPFNPPSCIERGRIQSFLPYVRAGCDIRILNRLEGRDVVPELIDQYGLMWEPTNVN